MLYLINKIEKAKVLRILSRRIRPQLGKVVLFWSDQSNLWSEANENFQNFLFCQFISRFILSLKMMITFGNEELLADGREKLPRIIDIARPTRLTIESTKIFSLGSPGSGVQWGHKRILPWKPNANTLHRIEPNPVAGNLQSALWRRLTKVLTTQKGTTGRTFISRYGRSEML